MFLLFKSNQYKYLETKVHIETQFSANYMMKTVQSTQLTNHNYSLRAGVLSLT